MSDALPRLSAVLEGPEGASCVTFIPGVGNDSTFWAAQAAALAVDHRVLRYDPWGYGESGEPPANCTVELTADAVVALWDSLGIERSSVVGLGLGGSTALAVAVRHPARVDRVVACCCRTRQPDDRRQFWRDRAALARAEGLEGLATAAVERWFSDEFRGSHPEVGERLRTAFLRSSIEGYAAPAEAFAVLDLDPVIGTLAAPTLLLAGEHDHGGGPVPAMRELVDRLPTARFEVIEGSGHIINHERPDDVAALLRGFLPV